jgi:hypothetical protein
MIDATSSCSGITCGVYVTCGAVFGHYGAYHPTKDSRIDDWLQGTLTALRMRQLRIADQHY